MGTWTLLTLTIIQKSTLTQCALAMNIQANKTSIKND